MAKKKLIGKDKAKIKVYYEAGQYWFNKARRIIRHLRRYPPNPKLGREDKVANQALKVALAAMPGNVQKDFQKLYKV